MRALSSVNIWFVDAETASLPFNKSFRFRAYSFRTFIYINRIHVARKTASMWWHQFTLIKNEQSTPRGKRGGYQAHMLV